MLFRTLTPAGWLLAGGLFVVVGLLAPCIGAQDSVILEIQVAEVTVCPGEDSVSIPIYLSNFQDTVEAFQMWVMLTRPDIMRFRIDTVVEVDTTFWECLQWNDTLCVDSQQVPPTGNWDFYHVEVNTSYPGDYDITNTLISHWEDVYTYSVAENGTDLRIFGVAHSQLPPYNAPIAPQSGGTLIKLKADVFPIPDTMTERTVGITIITASYFCFSDPGGNCLGMNGGEVDTSRVALTDGSLTVLGAICGDVDGSCSEANVADITFLVNYLFASGPPPPSMWAANVNGVGGVNIADVTYLVAYLFQGGASPHCSPDSSTGILADHTVIPAFDSIPVSYIEQVKDTFRIWYLHTSHGSQIVTGMLMLYEMDSIYNYNDGPGTLYLEEHAGDLGHNGDTTWVTYTRQRLNQAGNDINVVMWSWCGGVSDNTEEGINIYLDAVTQLEQDYPDVTFIYMTGHLDGTGPTGNLYVRNNQIRSYCETNHKILFDFADIESYDPDGGYYPDGSDACEWCYAWCSSNPCPECDGCAHSHCFNCFLKGKAFWWMMARMAGWNGN